MLVQERCSGKKQWLLKIFEGWCDNGKGRVTLLGDSVHAMQPNLGQGGCMAIEDSYQLAMELDKTWPRSIESGSPIDVVSSLRSYEDSRRLQIVVTHGLARMAAIMASTYKAYFSSLTKFRIPHPGRVGGSIFIDLAMLLMLSWVLGGNDQESW
ncbi:unnamed protein product [Camellia sinensis]